MKNVSKFLIAFMAFLFVSIAANAQITKEHAMLKNGKMYIVKVDIETAMKEDMTLKNGTVIMMDGTVKYKDGKKVKLMEGERVDMDGHIYDKDKKKKMM
ncbi:MAG: hypothetical protein JWM14_2100 [Chitinophagaceae bacterium]|nr:hypothetical protein [Chitinophagaceae bacterium]